MKIESASPDTEWLLGLGTSFQASRVLLESLRLGLFDLLDKAALPAARIARRLSLAPPAVERLLRVLVAMGLLARKGSIYRCTPISKKHLCISSAFYLGDFFQHEQSLHEPWSGLLASLKNNSMAPPERSRLTDYPRQLKKFLQAMDALGRLKSEHIMACLDMGIARSMLDLGGGMGAYGLSFCCRHPQLQAIVFDLPDVARLARLFIKKAGMQKRIGVAAGECLTDPLPPGPFDLVFISNLLHIYNEGDCKKILKKAVGVLAKGGTMVVHDYIFGCGDSMAAALFDMTMLIGTPQGRCYDQKDIKKWLRAAGIKKIHSAPVLSGTSILWGLK